MKRNLNLSILAHVDAGKTTLSEAMLFLSGRIRSAGRVDHGDTHLDTDAIEKDRGITIFSKQARFSVPDLSVTLLDTPGHVDFSAETERTLQVSDCAVLVISGTDGVQGHTGTLWRLLGLYGVPTIIFVNKMDLPGADKDAVMQELRQRLSADCVDFTAEDENWAEETALTDEALLSEWTEEGKISDESIAAAVGRRQLFPVWFGSALRMDGVQELLDGLSRFTPEKTYPEEFGMRVYKISRDPQGARLTWGKVTGGSLKVRMPVEYRSRSAQTEEGTLCEKIDQIRLYTGDSYENADEVAAGTLCVVTGLTETMPGTGIGAEPDGTEPVLEPVMTRRLLLPPGVNAGAFYRTVRVLEEEDPTLHIIWNSERGEINIEIMGEVQTEVLTKLIRDRFDTPVAFGPGRIVFKETVVQSVEGVGHFEPLRHYAEVHLLLEPGERGSGITCASAVSEDVLDLNWQRLILTHVMEREHPGVLTGSALTDTKITLVAGRSHLKHTEGGDFRQATYRAIRQGLKKTRTMLLEPWYAFVIEIPQDAFGTIMSELTRRTAECDPAEYLQSAHGEMVRLTGSLPVSESGDLQTAVHRASKGTGTIALTPNGYRECHNAAEMIEKIGYDSEADLQNPTGSVFCSHGSGFNVPWDMVPEYMHLPYAVWSQEDAWEAEEESDEGFRAISRQERAASGVMSADEEQMLNEIYARQFGMSREGVKLQDADRSGGRGRRKWNGSDAGEHVRRTDEVKQKLDKHGNPIYPPKDKREPMLIVDGYNVIFDWPELRDLAKHDLGAARGKLLDIVSNYQGFTAVNTTVVFDAWRTEGNPGSVSKYQNLTVVFTKGNETADAWIERTVHEEIGRANITVATSDGLEQLTIMRLGALRLSARMLKEEIERVSKEAGF
ncbi:MAG: TetM/TetW/TetO/TetS family tetracycline resistance ribosomal protection protein [Lachnospiraceae bacterium]|nr:TetM/TetW/TetO/TetS family tetracycline resistance ribosomal protection protein [Lachnospiraceae bacterium]